MAGKLEFRYVAVSLIFFLPGNYAHQESEPPQPLTLTKKYTGQLLFMRNPFMKIQRPNFFLNMDNAPIIMS